MRKRVLLLSLHDVGDRIDRGCEAFKACLGVHPTGFVAPAWLFNDTLLPSLLERGFNWTEDYWQIHDLRGGTAVDTPVMTWSSRTRSRRLGSMWLAPRLLRFWHDLPVLRVAVHPCDFDHAPIIDGIRKAIVQALRDRTFDTYENVLDIHRQDESPDRWQAKR